MARTLLETWKLSFLLALASNLFIKYNPLVGLGWVLVFVAGLVVLMLFFPGRVSERKG